jgi:hypothetical protein
LNKAKVGAMAIAITFGMVACGSASNEVKADSTAAVSADTAAVVADTTSVVK